MLAIIAMVCYRDGTTAPRTSLSRRYTEVEKEETCHGDNECTLSTASVTQEGQWSTTKTDVSTSGEYTLVDLIRVL